jgi:hypothetical protein
MLGVLAGLCCAVAFVEVAISHAKRRNVNGVLAGTALTACAILTVAVGVMIIPYLFRSLSAAFINMGRTQNTRELARGDRQRGPE